MWLVFPQCFMPSIHTTQCALSGEEIAADPLCGHKPLSIWPWSPIRTASFNQWDASNGSSSSWRLCPVFKSQTIGIIMGPVYFDTMRAISFQQGHELDEVPFSSANHQYAIKECHKLVDKRLNTKVHQDSTTSWERKTSIKNSWSLSVRKLRRATSIYLHLNYELRRKTQDQKWIPPIHAGPSS